MASPDSLAAIQISSDQVVAAFSSLLLYDYIISLADEVEYFWSAPCSLSGLLYLAIRYMGLAYAFFSIAAGTSSTLLHHPSTVLIVKLFVFLLPISALCQSVITLRIWFLFSRSPAVRAFAVVFLVAVTAADALLVGTQWNAIQTQVLNPLANSSSTIAWIFVPSLLIHSVLFALMLYRLLTSSVGMRTDSLLWGFVKEGMFMYAFATGSLVFGVVGLTVTKPSQLAIRTAAASGSPVVASIVISVCRVMLSIRSVAATAHVDPEWLLNHAELSRVHWRRGTADGEIIVETGEPAIQLATVSGSRYYYEK